MNEEEFSKQTEPSLQELKNHFILSMESYNRLSKIVSDNGFSSDLEGLCDIMVWIRTSLPCVVNVSHNSDDAMDIIDNKRYGCNIYSRLFIAISYVLGLDGRLIGLRHDDNINGHQITEIFIDGKWVAFDPTYALYYTKEGVLQSVEELHNDPTPAKDVTSILFDGSIELWRYFNYYKRDDKHV